MKLVLWILQGLLVVAFLAAGGQKLLGVESQVAEFDRYGYPLWFMYVTGIVEVTGALGLLVGFSRPVVTPFAALLIVGTMLGALFTHVRIGDPLQTMVAPFVLLLIAATVLSLGYARRGRRGQRSATAAGEGR